MCAYMANTEVIKNIAVRTREPYELEDFNQNKMEQKRQEWHDI